MGGLEHVGSKRVARFDHLREGLVDFIELGVVSMLGDQLLFCCLQ